MKRNYRAKYLLPGLLLFLSGCAASAQISKSAKAALLNDPAIATGHIGISIYEPATGKYWYSYNDTKNFIPASNTKLFTLYAGMKYLGDSLIGLRYQRMYDSAINVFATGDPTFLHPDFSKQPVLDFMEKEKARMYMPYSKDNRFTALANGWAWNDYEDDYMAERSLFPVYGNIVKFKYDTLKKEGHTSIIKWNNTPAYFNSKVDSVYLLPLQSWLKKGQDSASRSAFTQFDVTRPLESNNMKLVPGKKGFTEKYMTFHTNGLLTAFDILKNDFHIDITPGLTYDNSLFPGVPDKSKIYTIKSQPTDSLLKTMMHRSDNFFAEQTLLMVSNEKLGYMNDEAIIDTLLKTDLKDIPQKPRWVDGSGLSRYNLFTPRSFIYILDKMRTEFGMERMKNILATGGTGTLSAYYKKDSGYIFAKTGTLSNNCALGGYLVTKKGKLLLFSVLVNNYQSPAAPARRAVERFLQGIREKN